MVNINAFLAGFLPPPPPPPPPSALRVAVTAAATVLGGSAGLAAVVGVSFWCIRRFVRQRRADAASGVAAEVETYLACQGNTDGVVPDPDHNGEGPAPLKKVKITCEDGVVHGPYLTEVVYMARDKFFHRGFNAETEGCARQYMTRVMREHGMREFDIARNLPTMLTAVFYVTETERREQARREVLLRAGLLRMRAPV